MKIDNEKKRRMPSDNEGQRKERKIAIEKLKSENRLVPSECLDFRQLDPVLTAAVDSYTLRREKKQRESCCPNRIESEGLQAM